MLANCLTRAFKISRVLSKIRASCCSSWPARWRLASRASTENMRLSKRSGLNDLIFDFSDCGKSHQLWGKSRRAIVAITVLLHWEICTITWTNHTVRLRLFPTASSASSRRPKVRARILMRCSSGRTLVVQSVQVSFECYNRLSIAHTYLRDLQDADTKFLNCMVACCRIGKGKLLWIAISCSASIVPSIWDICSSRVLEECTLEGSWLEASTIVWYSSCGLTVSTEARFPRLPKFMTEQKVRDSWCIQKLRNWPWKQSWKGPAGPANTDARVNSYLSFSWLI